MPNTMKINDGVDARFVLANIAQMSDAAARPRLVQVAEVMMAQYERDVEALRGEVDEADAPLSQIKAIIPPDGVSYCYGCELVTPRKHVETPDPGFLGERYGQVITKIVCANCGRETYGRDQFVERLQKILYGESSWELRWDKNGNPRVPQAEGADHA